MSNTFLVTLRPFDYYFFGGEETFDSGAKGMANFQVQSNLLPQQTGLLGLLRHTLLTAGYPIGESFNGGHTNFGAISSISPLLLQHSNGDFLAPAPKLFSPGNANIVVGNRPGNEKIFLDNQWQDSGISAPGYEPKKGLSDFWVNITTGDRVTQGDIFSTSYHAGIDKQKRIANNEGDGGFYRQQFVTLHPDYKFAFYATFNQAIDVSLLPANMAFGGDKRLFALGFSTAAAGAWQIITQQYQTTLSGELNSTPCLVLLSDAQVTDYAQFSTQTWFGIMEEVPFRNLITPNNPVSFGSYTREPENHPNKLYKPKEAKFMIKRGSVFWFQIGAKAQMEAHLNRPVLHSIGYNHYLIF